MDNLKQTAYPMTDEEISEGNNLIASFMPDMKWHVPANKEYAPYWRQFDSNGYVRKDFTAGSVMASSQERFITLGYHKDWNRLKPVIDHIFTFSLAYKEETEHLRNMSIDVHIIPAWRACVKFAVFAKTIVD